MIVTLTPNPSIDQTLSLGEELERGTVQRLQQVTSVAGGKGVNVSHVAHLAGVKTLALFPSAGNDPFLGLFKDVEIPYHATPHDGPVRTNITITEPDGTTTKLNGPGHELSPATAEALMEDLLRYAEGASWVVLAGSLPPGLPADWYAQALKALRAKFPELPVAVDTSDAPLIELGKHLDEVGPTIMKPNGLELGQLVGVDGLHLEEEAEKGNYAPVIEAAKPLMEKQVDELLVTLGGAGAVLITKEGSWIANPAPITVVSTVGAGDCTLAGYVLARSRGMDHADALAQAVGYGSAAASLPGTTIPTPDIINAAGATVRSLA
ncbi:MAG: 1-phosphofructokinase family hexose kinase [Corynebacterium sp.]|nr:1-phosphofructokinase family hexose kinase [Corynebacterium sp.]